MAQDSSHIHISGVDPGTVAMLKNVADEAAERTVRRWVLALGINPDDPIAAQESFSALREISKPENRAALEWAKKTQARAEGVVGKALMTAVAIGVLGAAHWTWDGVRDFIMGFPGPNSSH